MDDDLLKKISKDGNLHPSNKVMDIVRKIVRATKEEDARICEEKQGTEWVSLEAGAELADAIRASK